MIGEFIAFGVGGLTLLGAFLNVKKVRFSFIIFSICNIYWAGYDFYLGATAQGFLMLAFLITSIYGYFSWTKEPDDKDNLI